MTRNEIIKQVVTIAAAFFTSAFLSAFAFHGSTMAKLSDHDAKIIRNEKSIDETKQEIKEIRKSSQDIMRVLFRLEASVANLSENLERVRAKKDF